ncbi:hypothetical protein BDA96_05G132600 [Sorghum bicolor]|uniref:Uncharacterized protein n=2 Tax=Sorghum bicolor TaxID=4558 RepID=A0A921QZV5_SORBI|nr:hypothetical protein BDA96_05G132600 [Sorghum bicolor]KXG28416.1 hypothetical protein SORBI_3005G119700 [Sorghum bicolor]
MGCWASPKASAFMQRLLGSSSRHKRLRGGSCLSQLIFMCTYCLPLPGLGVIVIAGANIRAPVTVARAFDSKITCPSFHFIGTCAFFFINLRTNYLLF